MQETVNQIRLYLKSAWRRKWLGIVVAWMVAVGGSIYVFTLPNVYEAHARVYVDTDSMLTPLLDGLAVRSDVGRQVRVIQDTLLSRPNLRKVAKAADLDLDANNPAEMERILNRIEAKTSINSEGPGIFLVTYNDRVPETAKNVVQALLTIFIESNLGENRSDLNNARSFIDEQILMQEKKLIEAERRMAEFRAENADVIGQTNYTGRLQTAQRTIEEARLTYTDAVVKRDQLRTQLAATPRFVTLETAPQVVIGDQQVPSTLMRIRQLQQQLDDLMLRYTDVHPDVVTSKRQLELLVEQYDREQSGAPGTSATSNFANTTKLPNPIYEQIQIRLIDAESEVAQSERRLSQANRELERIQEYAKIAPAIVAEMSDITRQYEVLQANYNVLVGRKESADLTFRVESSTDALKFRMIEAPELPISPAGPQRQLFLGMVLLLALGAGGGAAFLRSQLEETYFAPEQLENSLKIPVLGTVTRVMSVQDGARHALASFGFFLASSCLFVFFAGLFLILFFFDPASGDGGSSFLIGLL